MGLFKKETAKHELAVMAAMVEKLDRCYSNKSGDEYKMHGDITKSPVYDMLQRTIADLPTIKGVSRIEIDELKKMFNAMHRPNFKKIVTDYIVSKKSEAIMMTATFTVAYRVLIGELSRIYTSTEATPTGFIYKPDKISKKQDMSSFIRNFNVRIDSELTKHVRSTTKKVDLKEKFKMEAVAMEAFLGSSQAVAGALSGIAERISPYFKEFGAWCKMLFPDVSFLNPVSWFSNILSNTYDKKVDKYHDMAKMYLETKKAYDEYMDKPAFRRNKKVEKTYLDMINKYNIKMLNAKAAIRDYDQRSIKETMEEAKREEAAMGGYTAYKPEGYDDDKVDKKESKKEEKVESNETESKPSEKPEKPEKKEEEVKPSKPASNDDDPFDF